MTDEQIRVAIAEAVGWTEVRFVLTENSERGIEVWMGTAPNGNRCCRLPYYLNDLNAMHESLRAQSKDFRLFFQNELERVAIRKGCLWIDLTARDWAEAFIATIGRKEGV